MAVSNEIFLIGIKLVIYLVIALNWEFELFDNGEGKGKTNVIKILIIWLMIWLQPLLTQYAILIANSLGRTANELSLLGTIYQVNIWLSIVISFILVIFFIMQVMIYTGGVMPSKK